MKAATIPAVAVGVDCCWPRRGSTEPRPGTRDRAAAAPRRSTTSRPTRTRTACPTAGTTLRDVKLVLRGGAGRPPLPPVRGPQAGPARAVEPGLRRRRAARPRRSSSASGSASTRSSSASGWARSRACSSTSWATSSAPLRRGLLGPWTRSVGTSWTRVAKRIPVPPGTHDAIMSVGLLGATGVLEVDGLTIDLIPGRRLRDDEPGRQRRLRAGRSRPRLLESSTAARIASSPGLNRTRRSCWPGRARGR